MALSEKEKKAIKKGVSSKIRHTFKNHLSKLNCFLLAFFWKCGSETARISSCLKKSPFYISLPQPERFLLCPFNDTVYFALNGIGKTSYSRPGPAGCHR